MGITSQRGATHIACQRTTSAELQRGGRAEPTTQGQSCHAITVNARGSRSICTNLGHLIRRFGMSGFGPLKNRPLGASPIPNRPVIYVLGHLYQVDPPYL